MTATIVQAARTSGSHQAVDRVVSDASRSALLSPATSGHGAPTDFSLALNEEQKQLQGWVHDFAADWSASTGVRVEEDKAERLFRLDELTPPAPAPGTARPATDAEVGLLTEWLEAFCVEVGIDEPMSGQDSTRRSIEEGRRFVWDAAGEVVCDVGHNVAVGGQVRIGPVYTPPVHRGRGYASNLTAHVTARIIERGLVPTLFTDLTNPTSNGIYQALGYRKVADAFMLRFVPAD